MMKGKPWETKKLVHHDIPRKNDDKLWSISFTHSHMENVKLWKPSLKVAPLFFASDNEHNFWDVTVYLYEYTIKSYQILTWRP